MRAIVPLLLVVLASTASAQSIPNVTCRVEDYPQKSVIYWQSPQTLPKVQVVVLRDPAGEQEARFDLMHGASLLSLRYKGKEMLYAESAGADVAMFAFHRPRTAESNGNLYSNAFNPDQGGSSMGIPATVAGVACQGEQSMRAFATMIDRSSDSSFQKNKLLGVWAGKITDNFPPGYSTPYTIETNASWVKNPRNSPQYYLKLDQSVVNVYPESSGALQWFLSGAAPWDFAHYTSYPEQCIERTPCTSTSTAALASGHYADSAKTIGFAAVVPTNQWNTSKAFLRDNAEYVVLIYGAVWAAPRRTFSAVLERPVDGLSAFQFSWFVCAGSWDNARSFASEQPKAEGVPLPSADLPEANPSEDEPIAAACEQTEYRMEPNQPEQAIVLRDPAREQTALFDVVQGGALVSLKYKGTEHVWGYNGGGLLQMAFHNGMTRGAWRGDYNPTQAGDGSAMSPVTGIACEKTNSVHIMTMMLDFNHNNAFYDKPLIAVWNGRINDMVPLSYFSPYVLETQASWVRNPSGEPKYYLQLKERLTHLAPETVGSFDFDFAAYAPWEFKAKAVNPEKCPCDPKTTNYVSGGFYRSDYSDGLAVAMPSKNFKTGPVGGGGATEPMWRNHSFHLNGKAALDGIASKSFVWYVLVGKWENAAAFARGLE